MYISFNRLDKLICFLLSPQLIETEVHRKIKQEPALCVECDIKVSLQGPKTVIKEVSLYDQDVVNEVWAFN